MCETIHFHEILGIFTLQFIIIKTTKILALDIFQGYFFASTTIANFSHVITLIDTRLHLLVERTLILCIWSM